MILGCLVTIAAVVALFGSSYYGVKQVQNNTRDYARRNTVKDVSVAITRYFSENGKFPERLIFEHGYMYVAPAGVTTCSGSDKCVKVSTGDIF